MARILVADDDADIRELVQLKLESAGHEVVVAVDGEAALASLRAARPDLALLDVMMPGRSGLEVLDAVRADPALADLPVVLLTARAHAADVEAAIRSGVDDYVVKPFSPRDLAVRVQAMLAGRR